MFKSLSDAKIYESSDLALSFEFFTPLNKRELAAKLNRALGKKVRWSTEIDFSFNPTNEEFKLSPVYSNAYKECCFETGFMPYHEALHMMLKTMNFIGEVGYTDSRCGMKVKIRLDEKELGLAAPIHSLNKLKYLLNLDEQVLFNKWPREKNEEARVHHNQLMYIQPRNVYTSFITEAMVERMDPHDFNFPQSDFFANDFSELEKGYLIANYIGGEGYQQKKQEVTETINFLIKSLVETLSSNYAYSAEEKEKIKNLTQKFKTASEGTRDYFNLKKSFPNLDVLVDLNPDTRLIESNYLKMREKIFALVFGAELREGIINYDTKRKTFQVKDAKISRGLLIEGVEFYQCEIAADAKSCLFDRCIIKNSKLQECLIYSNNFIKSSKILDCNYLGELNEISSSYLDNPAEKKIHANLRECLVNRGTFTLQSTIDQKTKLIERIN